MKVYLLYAKENWITDELAKEWIVNNKELYTNNINEADIIWILSNYMIKQLLNQTYPESSTYPSKKGDGNQFIKDALLYKINQLYNISAFASGSIFSFYNAKREVLLNYPQPNELRSLII